MQQMDYIPSNEKMKNVEIAVKVARGLFLGSDHCVVFTELRILEINGIWQK